MQLLLFVLERVFRIYHGINFNPLSAELSFGLIINACWNSTLASEVLLVFNFDHASTITES